jgi:glucose/arabinose dehydrogenase
MSYFLPQFFAAYHGSWNRPADDLTGFKVVLVSPADAAAGGNFDDWNVGDKLKQQDFITGFLAKDKTAHWGRPVSFTPIEDGSILVCDDYNDAVYKVQTVDN